MLLWVEMGGSFHVFLGGAFMALFWVRLFFQLLLLIDYLDNDKSSKKCQVLHLHSKINKEREPTFLKQATSQIDQQIGYYGRVLSLFHDGVLLLSWYGGKPFCEPHSSALNLGLHVEKEINFFSRNHRFYIHGLSFSVSSIIESTHVNENGVFLGPIHRSPSMSWWIDVSHLVATRVPSISHLVAYGG